MDTDRIVTRARAICAKAAQAFTWAGGTYYGAPSSHQTAKTYRSAGLTEQFTGSLLCDASQFATTGYPPERAVVTFRGREVRIISVEVDPLEACVRLDLGGKL